MTEVLTQDEIDQLLTAINAGDTANSFENIEAFEDYLIKREFRPEKPYGIFEKDISICRFFGSGKNENTLEDIKKKNEKEGYGNIKIPNTEITLINYSICQNCKNIYSFKLFLPCRNRPPGYKRHKHRQWGEIVQDRSKLSLRGA